MMHRVPLLCCSIALVLSVLAVWSAWDNGGGYYRTQMMVAVFLLLSGLLGVIGSWVTASGRLKNTVLLPPLVAVIAMAVWSIAFLQTLSIPLSVAGFLAPGSLSVYTEWIPDGIHGEALDAETVSLAGLADASVGTKVSVACSYTRMAMLGPAAFAVVCWLSYLCFISLRAVLVFLFVLATSGALFSFFGLVDTIRLTRDWQFEIRQALTISPVGAEDPFGPFVNNNNCAGFLCLAIGCAFGLLVFVNHWSSVTQKKNFESHSARSSGWHVIKFGCLLMIVVMVAAVIGSNSRGGFLGLLAGTLVMAAVMLPRTAKWKGIAAVLMTGTLAWLIVAGLGLGERSGERLGTLTDRAVFEDPRLDHWADALVAARHYLPFGSGLGSYRYACLPFQEQGASMWFVNADGMHMEWLVEGGLWLLPLVILGIGIVLRDVLRIGKVLHRSSDLPPEFAALARSVVAVAAFAIPATIVTQCFDYGITLPPMLIVCAAITGAILRTSRTAGEFALQSANPALNPLAGDAATGMESAGRSSIKLARLLAGPAFLILVSVALAMAAKDLDASKSAQEIDLQLQRDRKSLLVDMPDLSERVARLESISAANTDNSLVWRTLAKLRLAEQERLGVTYLFSIQPENYAAHSAWVTPANVRHAAYGSEGDVAFANFLLPTQDVDQWRLAREELIAALLLNPLDDSARLALVELDRVRLGANTDSAELLSQAARLRSRTESYLKYLIWLAEDYPGAMSVSEIQRIRQDLLTQ